MDKEVTDWEKKNPKSSEKAKSLAAEREKIEGNRGWNAEMRGGGRGKGSSGNDTAFHPTNNIVGRRLARKKGGG